MLNALTPATNLETSEYQLLNFKLELDGTLKFQTISFYEKVGDAETNGTTLEEMLRVSIARLKDLNSRFSCRENALAITKMEEALMWLNARTADRIKRGVEGQHTA